MSRWIVVSVLLFCIPIIVFGDDDYSDEKKVITDMIETMETYSTAMAEAETCGSVADANNTLSDSLEIYAPRMKALSDEYPEWGETPPDEIRPLIDRYMEAYAVFNSESLKKAVDYANTYTDDQELQDSFRRLNIIIWELF